MSKLIPILALFLLAGCHKENVTIPGQLDAPLVTGFQTTDNLGNPGPLIGTPNDHTSETRNGISYNLIAYPNPVSRVFYIRFAEFPQSNSKRSLWITPARLENDLSQFNFAGSNQLVVGGNPIIKLEDILPPTNSFRFDLSGFPAGAYRVYVQSDEVLLWTNIILQK